MKQLTALLLALPLALLLGCGSDNPDTDEPTGNAGVETFSATLHAEVPNGIVGNFLLDDELVCEGTSLCEVAISKAKDVTLVFDCPSHLFVPLKIAPTMANNGQTINVDWSTPGSWGLAPDGKYNDDFGDNKVDVKTWIEDGKVTVDLSMIWATVTGNTFSGKWKNQTLEGTISDDLKAITYVYDAGGNIAEGTYTLLE